MAYNPDSLAHKAARKALEIVVDAGIKHVGKDRQKAMNQFVDMAERFIGDTWSEEAYRLIREQVDNVESKWYKFVYSLFDDVDPKQLKMLALNAGYESGFVGYKAVKENAKKYGCSIPWVVLIDPTSACNLHCTGCWAAEYGHTMSLTYEQIYSVIDQGRKLGIHAYVMTGGEPMTRRKDIVRLAEEFPDCLFMLYTNGTLVDDSFCEEMVRVGNIVLNISIEGFKEANDKRRGEGTYERILAAMDRLKAHKCLFGTSICYTSDNYMDVTSDEFLDLLVEHGAKIIWYFHYMPVGCAATTGLMLTPEQREYMLKRIRWIRGFKTGKKIMAIDFQNDGEYIHGCIAGGKYYCHINPNGDMEPCVFIHYSGANIKEKSLIECLQQPLFLEYQKNQPFNSNHLRPCPMLENPQRLREMVKKTGAKSTDMESPEDVDHLCDKCEEYAKKWAPDADRLWEETHPSKSSSAAR